MSFLQKEFDFEADEQGVFLLFDEDFVADGDFAADRDFAADEDFGSDEEAGLLQARQHFENCIQ